MQIPKYFYFRVKPGKFDFIFEDASDVDVAEVVRCKDCRWHEDEEPGMVLCPRVTGSWVSNEFFCASGRRKGGAE